MYMNAYTKIKSQSKWKAPPSDIEKMSSKHNKEIKHIYIYIYIYTSTSLSL